MNRVLSYLRRPRLLLVGLFGVAMCLAWFGVWVRVREIRPAIHWQSGDPLDDCLVCFSGNGEWLVTARQAEAEWDKEDAGERQTAFEFCNLRTGELRRLKFARHALPERLVSYYLAHWDFELLRVSQGGDYFAMRVLDKDGEGASVERIEIYDTLTGQRMMPLNLGYDSPEGPSTQWQFSPTGSYLTCTARSPKELDSGVWIWDVKHGAPVHVLKLQSLFAYSADGRMLATRTDWSESVIVWDVETGKEIARLGRARDNFGVMALAFTPDATRLTIISSQAVTGNERGQVEASLWNIGEARCIATLIRQYVDPYLATKYAVKPDGGGVQWFTNIPEQHEWVFELQDWSERSPRRIFNAANESSYCRDQSGRWAFGFSRDVPSTSFGPFSRWWSSRGGEQANERYRSDRLIDLDTGRCVLDFRNVEKAVLSPNGKRIAMTDHTGRVEIYDLPPRRPVELYLLLSALPALLFTGLLWWRVR